MTRRRTEHIGPPLANGVDERHSKAYTDAPLCGGVDERKYEHSPRRTRTSLPDGDRTCPKCQALYYADKLAKEFPGVTITATKDYPDGFGYSTGSAYRGVHAVHVNGQLRGFVCSENGWGNGYTAHRAVNRDRDGVVSVETYDCELPTGRVYTGTLPRNQGQDVIPTRKHFGSKEHAAYAMCLYILGRALKGWGEFPAPMAPADFLAFVARREQQRATEKEERRVQDVATAERRGTELEAEAETYRGYIERLRGLNLESDADAEAVRWAIDIANAKLSEQCKRISDNEAYAQRRREGREL